MGRSSTPILEATLRLIARGGVGAVRYRDVAAESKVALGTISYQFPSREELLRAAFAHYIAENTASLRASLSSARLESPEDVGRLCASVVRSDLVDPTQRYLAEYELLVYAARDPLVAVMVAEWDRRVVVEAGEIVERMGVPAPLSTAQTLLEMIRGFQLSALGQPEQDLDEFARRVTHVVAALGPSVEAPARKPRASPRSRRPRRPA